MEKIEKIDKLEYQGLTVISFMRIIKTEFCYARTLAKMYGRFEMKKLVALAVVAFVAIGASFAADLVINGSVTAALSVAITNSPITVTLDGTGTAGTVDRTATLNAKSNKKNWTVSFDSANDGKLKSALTGVEIPYLLQASTPAWGSAGVTNGLATAVNPEGKTIVVTDGKTPRDGVNFTLTVTVPAQDGAAELFEAATDYTDTITISIAAS